VARAYRELEAQGLVASRVRHGTTVTGDGSRLTSAEIRSRLADAARAYAGLARQLGVPDAAATAAVDAALADRRDANP
jgi:GntR family transcriptional regulator